MKTFRSATLIFLIYSIVAHAELKPDDLINAVDQMTPEQVQEFRQKLEAKMWKPVPQGFFTRMAADFSVSSSSIDTINLSSISLSGGEMDLDQLGGADVGILWRFFGERFRFGFRFSNWGTIDSNLGPAGYSRVEVAGGNLSLTANYQWFRSASWLIWTEIAPGSGSVSIETVDTPSGSPTTLRALDGTFGQVDMQIGASWRFNPVLSFFLTSGYRFAESINLDEGNKTSSATFDASGFNARAGLGINF